MKPRRLVFLLAALLFLWNLGGRDLWAPDEPYFAEGAREMVADGRWAVPHVNGAITTDKPPLFFWSIALLSLPLGEVTLWTARLPSALAALGTLLLVIRLGRRLGSERTAWLSGLVLATAVMFWDKARWSQIDALLCFLVWCSLSAFEAWRAGDAVGGRAGRLFWLAAALAVLAKGPVGFLLPLGVALCTLVTDRQVRAWRRFAPLSGPLLFAAVVGLWMLLATLGSGGEYSVWGALREHFVDRGIHGLHHRQPPWYYLKVLPPNLLPWIGLVPGALLLAWRRRDETSRFLLVASLFVVVFFSVSTEKRGLYVLPAFPAFALLVALLLDHLLPSMPEKRLTLALVDRRWLFGGQLGVGVLLSLVGIALPFAARERDEVAVWVAAVLGALLAATGLATLWACLRRQPLAASLLPAAGMAAGYLWASTFVYPALDKHKSARAFSETLRAATAASRVAGHEVLAYDLSNLPEAFAFYTDGLYTVETHSPDHLTRHLSQRAQVWAAVHRPGLAELPPDLQDRLTILEEARLSRRDVLLVTNGEPD